MYALPKRCGRFRRFVRPFCESQVILALDRGIFEQPKRFLKSRVIVPCPPAGLTSQFVSAQKLGTAAAWRNAIIVETDTIEADPGKCSPPAVGKNRNIMLYWDDANPFPQDIIAVTEKWRNVCPAWNVMLFGQETACDNLRENFGGDIARLFLICGIPAMRADFFRVVWAISDGGIYSDMTYVPKIELLFFDPGKDVT